MLAKWPEADAARDDRQAQEQMETLIALITKVRNIRSEMNIPIQTRLKLCIGTKDERTRALVSENSEQIKRLVRAEDITIYETLPELESAPRDIVAGMEIAVPLGGLIDFEKERERVTKELTRKENEARSLAARLDNLSFMERAPREVVQETRDRHDELIAEIEKLRATFTSLG